MRTITAGLLALALAGCGGKTSSADGNGYAANRGEVDDAPSSAQVARPAATPASGVPSETPPRAFEVRRDALAFPTAFQGRWGLTDADCDLSRIDDAKGRMNIEPNRIAFYESRATVRAMPSKGPYKLVADLDYSGEGQKWQRREQFALVTAGIALLRTEPGENGAAERVLRYERC